MLSLRVELLFVSAQLAKTLAQMKNNSICHSACSVIFQRCPYHLLELVIWYFS